LPKRRFDAVLKSSSVGWFGVRRIDGASLEVDRREHDAMHRAMAVYRWKRGNQTWRLDDLADREVAIMQRALRMRAIRQVDSDEPGESVEHAMQPSLPAPDARPVPPRSREA
jgi:hypothetical protein